MESNPTLSELEDLVNQCAEIAVALDKDPYVVVDEDGFYADDSQWNVKLDRLHIHYKAFVDGGYAVRVHGLTPEEPQVPSPYRVIFEGPRYPITLLYCDFLTGRPESFHYQAGDWIQTIRRLHANLPKRET
jgi:hypothetical protein